MHSRFVLLLTFLALAVSLHAAPLSGTKSIGPTGNYASIGAAITDIQAQTVGGPLVLELQAAYVSTVETFPLVVPALNSASAVNTVTIRPASGAAALSITSANTTAATVDLNGAQFVTFDGRPGGAGTAKQLTIANTSTSGVAVRFINEASGDTLRFLIVQGVNRSASSGTVLFSTTTGANGNDNNTIDTCDIRDGATTPTNALYSLGTTTTTAQNNSGNTVSHCNVFNFYRSSAVDAAGVRIEGGNTGWSITDNSFYQTVSRAAPAANVRAIYVNNTSGNNFTVTGNFIGGTTVNAGGTAWTTTGTSAASRFQGIVLLAGATTPSSVQGNTIQNFVWTTGVTTSQMPGNWSGVYVAAGSAEIGTITGNTIGSGTGTGSIAVTTSGDGTTFGICANGGSTVAIANNTIGSITTSGTTAGIFASLVGIQVATGANTIANNTVGSTTTANSLNAATSVTALSNFGQQVTGILSSSSSASITGNTVDNLNNNYNSSGPGQIQGIVTAAGVNTITGNTIRNLTTTSQNTGASYSASVLGISQTSSSPGQTISQNVVHSLTNTAVSAGVQVIGIYCLDLSSTPTSPNLIARNLMHSFAIASTSTSSFVYGMYFEGGALNVQNNMMRVGLDAIGASTAGAASIYGIFDNSTKGGNFYHNSVYVGGTQTSGPSRTYAFNSVGTVNARDIRNNIFVNARSKGGTATGNNYAVVYNNGTAASPNPAGLMANNNLFFVSGTGGVLGLYNFVDRTTLAAWQAATGQDVSSAVADPRFVNPTGDATAVNLHLQANNPTEGGGLPIASVIDDFDGQTRSSLTPVDIGADAGSFTSSSGDIYAPFISYPLPPNSTTANRTLTGWASIVDNSGSIASGANAPRFYYKKSTDADAFGGNTAADNGWKYVTATGSSGSYSFAIDYSLINGGSVSVGDSIQYFVVAQDVAGNLASGPAAATASANPPVQNINAKPGAGVNSYSIGAALNGAVTVGPGGTYPTLTRAGGLFAALSSGVLTGNLTVSLTGDTTEDGSTVLNGYNSNGVNYPPTANTFTVTIQPDSATMRIISGAGASGLIRLNGANRVTIDGSFGGSGRYLTFRYTNSNSNAATITFINDASNNTVRNCMVEGASTNAVVYFGAGVTTGNDNNTLTGNQIRDRSDAGGVPGYLVYSAGSSDAVANSNNTISNNELFNFIATGVAVASGSDSWSITGNTVYQTAARGGYVMSGIYFNGLGTNTIRGNTVRDLTTSADAKGIELGSQTGNTTVAGNRIWNIGTPPDSTSIVMGILFQPGAGQSVMAVNNMIALSSSGTTAQYLLGIYDGGSTGSTTVTADNTVLLTGTGGAGVDSWAFKSACTSTATVKNNVFLNLRTGGGNHFAANRLPASPVTMDYNVYAGTGRTIAANFFDASSATNGTPISYAQWQANVPSDTHSGAGNPGGNFTSAMFVNAANGDLHLVPGGNVLVNNTGTPIAGVTMDFDGTPRSATAPYIGADELLTPFQQWAQANGLPLDPAANGGANLLNFAFGLNADGSSTGVITVMTGVITQRGTPTTRQTGTPSGVDFKALFGRRKNSGLTYTIQFSADLAGWENNTVTPAVIADDGLIEACTVPYPFFLSDGQKARFFRVSVQ